MDIFFCDICNESVPQSDLDKGMAFRRGDRVVCAACDKAMSNEDMDGEYATGEPGAADTSADGGKGPQGDAAKEETTVFSVTESRPQGGGIAQKVSGCLIAVLFVCVFVAFLASAFLWFELDRVRGLSKMETALLQQENAAAEGRFSDLQVRLSMLGQERDANMRESLEAMNGMIDEKVSNLGNRIGRADNSLEALRQSSAEDRRALEVGSKDAALKAGLANGRVDSMEEGLDYLVDRITALEEVLEGGLGSGGGAASGGQQPSWYSQLPDLKDASAGNRWNAVTVLGDTGDARVVPHLMPMLSDDDVFVRMATARVLGDLGSPSAIPGLIDGLSDDQAAVREAAVVALRVLSGKDFRFDPLGKDSDRRRTQGFWRKWWGENSEDLLDG